MNFKNVNERKYSNATIVGAFCYFALSRTAYRRFGENFELPSISTLIRLTSFSKSYDNVAYYSKLLLNLTDQQKTCILFDFLLLITGLRCPIDENAQSKFGLEYIERYFLIKNCFQRSPKFRSEQIITSNFETVRINL